MRAQKLFGYIILHEIPKKEVQIDLAKFEIKGGFRGFAEVLPGNHFINIKINKEKKVGFWCFVKPNDVVIRIYDNQSEIFVECDPKEEETIKEMALSGIMNQNLIPVNLRSQELAIQWKKLTNHMFIDAFPYKFHFENPMNPPTNVTPDEMSHWFMNEFKSRFELAFYDSHAGEIESFLEEFQFAFVKYLVEQKDQIALSRWFHLLTALKGAGENSITKEPELFAEFSDIIIEQFNNFSDQFLLSQTKLIEGFDNLLEDLKDSGIEILINKSKSLEKYLKSRGIKL